MKIVIVLVLSLLVYLLFVLFFSGNQKPEIDYYPDKYEWKCKTDIECFEEERACLASGACVRQR